MFSDIDECSTKSYSCDVNAVCSNTVGSYACPCTAGYTGDQDVQWYDFSFRFVLFSFRWWKQINNIMIHDATIFLEP